MKKSFPLLVALSLILSCEPEEVNVPVSSISVSPTELTLREGETKSLSVTVSPSDATDKSVAWTSSAPAVATVADGRVTAVSVGQATVTVAAKDGSGKQATCQVNVLYGGAALTLDAGQAKDFTVGTEGAELKVAFTAREAWTAALINPRADSWIKVSPASGTEGKGEITIKVAENTDFENRNASITITCGAETETITVHQKQKDALTLTADRFELGKEGGTITVQLKSNVLFSFQIDGDAASWIRSAGTRSYDDYTCQFVVSENFGISSREGRIVFTAGDLSETVYVFQEGTEPALVISEHTYEVGPEGGQIRIDVKSNVDVRMVIPEEATWLQEMRTRALSTSTFYLVAEPNPEPEGRTATVVFLNDATGLSEKVTVNQRQMDVMDLQTDGVTVPEAGGRFDITLEANVDYDVTISGDWVKEVTSKAPVAHTHTFLADPLPEDQLSREAAITFAAPQSGLSKTVSVVQNEETPIIQFKDEAVKAICVALWDRNGDGELSEREAAVVTSLGGAFQGNKNIVSFDELSYFTGLTAIGENEFANCTALESITLPAGITTIGRHAFYGCTSLTRLTCLPSTPPTCGEDILGNAKDGWIYVPEGCLQAYRAADGWKDYTNRIVDGADDSLAIDFQDPAVKAICINKWDKNGDGELSEKEAAAVTSLGGAFYQNKDIVSFDELPYFTGLTAIGESEFQACTALKSITLPAGITQIGRNAFRGCSSLGRMTCLPTIPPLCDESILSETKNGWIFVPKGYVQSYQEAGGWKSYADRITDSEDDTPAITFQDPAVKAVCIGKWDKNDDGELSRKEASVVTSLEKAFRENKDIVAFDELSYFTGLKTIDTGEFAQCSSLAGITLPAGITSIGQTAFFICSSLARLTCLPSVPPTCGENFLYGTKDGWIIVPKGCAPAYRAADGWKDYAGRIIDGADDTSPIVFQDPAVKAICVERWDKNGDGELSEMEAAAVTALGRAFSQNKDIVAFDELAYFTGVKAIGGSDFLECSSLTSITLPASITSIGSYAFYGCSSLGRMTCRATTPPTCGEGFLLYTKEGWIFVPKGCVQAYQAADGWKDYAGRITDGEDDTPAIDFQDAAVKAVCVERWDRNGDGKLSEKEAAVVTSLDRAFHENKDIVSFDELACFTGLTQLLTSEFSECSSLESITLPEGITLLGSFAFYQCASLGRLTCLPQDPPACGERFLEYSKDGWIIVPKGRAEQYKAADGWKDYASRILDGEDDSPAINFKDPVVKAICVERWDKNSDGELSEKEAAAVANLNWAFSSNTEITSFDEFAYFTGVKDLIGGNVFGNCPSLVSITLPEGITRLDTWTFGRCTALKELTLPASVVEVGTTCFYGCSALDKLICLPTVPPKCGNSFLDQTKEGWIIVPKGCVDIYKAADGWKDYARRIISADEEDSPAIAFKDPTVKALCVQNWDKDGDGELSEREAAAVGSLGRVFYDNREITSFDELAYFTGLQTIDNNAFSNCAALASVGIPEGLTAVGEWAFFNCDALNGVVLPAGVTSIGPYAFYGCVSLGKLTCLAPNPPTCGENFLEFSKDGWIVVPEGSVSRYKAADGWKDYPSRIVTAAELVSPVIPFKDPAVKAVCLGRWDRDGDGELTEREAATVTSIPAWIFTNNLDIVTFDELAYFSGLKGLEDSAFSGCSNLKSITLPEGLERLGKHSLGYCPALANVVFLSTVPPEYGESAMVNSKEGWIIVPDGSVQAYQQAEGWNAFPERIITAGELDSPVISFQDPAAKTACVNKWDRNGDGEFTWREAASVTYFWAGDDFSAVRTFDEFVYFTGLTRVSGFENASNLTSIQFPPTVKEIADDAFARSGLQGSLTLPEGLETIGQYAFTECAGLTGTLVLPSSLTSIGRRAFNKCHGFTGDLTIPDGITVIPYDAFFECSGMDGTLTLPASIQQIEEWAFGCTPFSRIDILAQTVPDCGEYAFEPTGEGCLIYVPAGKAAIYQETAGWTEYRARITEDGHQPYEFFYSSTDYSRDGEVVCLQRATEGKGIDIVFIGDGYLDRDLGPGGKFETDMRVWLDQLFVFEPYRTYRNWFNVYMVKAVSKNDIYHVAGSDRIFTEDIPDGSGEFGNSIDVKVAVCQTYAEKAPTRGRPWIAMFVNSNTDVGRSFCSYGTAGGCLASIFNPVKYSSSLPVLNHELGGHGFGWLADEYEEYPSSPSNPQQYIEKYHSWNAYPNADWHSDPTMVPWARFIQDSRYAYENLGAYEGACSYAYGLYRPTNNSLMRFHYLDDAYFNAPSREAIYKNIMRWGGEDDWEYDYETFVAIDDAGRVQAQELMGRKSANQAPNRTGRGVLKDEPKPGLPPVRIDESVRKIRVSSDGKITLVR